MGSAARAGSILLLLAAAVATCLAGAQGVAAQEDLNSHARFKLPHMRRLAAGRAAGGSKAAPAQQPGSGAARAVATGAGAGAARFRIAGGSSPDYWQLPPPPPPPSPSPPMPPGGERVPALSLDELQMRASQASTAVHSPPGAAAVVLHRAVGATVPCRLARRAEAHAD